MNAYTILYALNGVRGGYIQEAAPAPEGIRRLCRPLRILLAASAIAALLLGTALALSPGLRAALGDALGSFLPYVRPVEEEGVTDQGIRIKPVAALSDGNAVQVYFAVTDLTGDRLDENTHVMMVPDMDKLETQVTWASMSFSRPMLIAYDPEVRTGLFCFRLIGKGEPVDGLSLPLLCAEIQPGISQTEAPLDPAWIGSADLVTEETEQGQTVLVPEQTPRDLGSSLYALSSFGFGDDGVLHIQLRINVPVLDWDRNGIGFAPMSIAEQSDPSLGWDRTQRYTSGRVPDMTEEEQAALEPETRFTRGGIVYWDYRTGITRADLSDVDFGDGSISVNLKYREDIYGNWDMEIPVTDVEKQSVDMLPTGTVLEGVTAQTLHLSTIGCTLVSDPGGNPGTIGYALTVYLTDGTTVSAGEADSLFHAERHAANHWSFPEPVEVEAITGIAFGQWYVPLDNGVAGRGHWLETAP